MQTMAKCLAGVLAFGLTGCAATQNDVNTVEMAEGVSHIREAQVLHNISAAISDHDVVPSQILLGQGTSVIDLGAGASVVKFPFSSATKEFDLSPTDVWHAQWVFTSVTDANDLRRLRNLYSLVASTDDQYRRLEGYLDRHYKEANPIPCRRVLAQASSWHERNPTIGSEPGNSPPWILALCTMKEGDSIDCKLFQEDWKQEDWKQNDTPTVQTAFPFRRWLYWRESDGPWLPNTPDMEPQPLGKYGDWELGTTSRACFDDFVILVQGQVPKTEEKSKSPQITITAPQ